MRKPGELIIRRGILEMRPGESKLFCAPFHLTSTLGIKVIWDPFHPDWIASAANKEVAQAMIATQDPVNIQEKGRWIIAQTIEVSRNGRRVTMRKEGGEIFQMNTEGQDMTKGLPTLREAIPGQRTFPTLRLIRLSQLINPDSEYEREDLEKGTKQIVRAQALYPLRAWLKELRETNSNPWGGNKNSPNCS